MTKLYWSYVKKFPGSTQSPLWQQRIIIILLPFMCYSRCNMRCKLNQQRVNQDQVGWEVEDLAMQKLHFNSLWFCVFYLALARRKWKIFLYLGILQYHILTTFVLTALPLAVLCSFTEFHVVKDIAKTPPYFNPAFVESSFIKEAWKL